MLEQAKTEVTRDALYLLGILSIVASSVLPLQMCNSTWDGCQQVDNDRNQENKDINEMTQQHIDILPDFMMARGEACDSYRLVEAVALLASLSLIKRHGAGTSMGVSMHALTHAWARDRQKSEQQQRT